MKQLLSLRLARLTATLAAGCCLLSATSALAYAPELNLLEIKGFSPGLIRTLEIQRSKQEWHTPPPRRLTPSQQFWHNAYYNDWTGTLDEFGSMIIREHP